MMSAISAVLVVALVATAAAQPHCEPKMPFRAAAREMLEECIGKEQMERNQMKMAPMLEGCMKKQPHEFMGGKPDSAAMPSTGDSKVDAVMATLHYRMSNFTCMIYSMELVNDKGDVNIGKWKDHIDSTFTDRKMKEDLHEDIVDCEKFSKALPSGLITRGKPPMLDKMMPDSVFRCGALFHCFRGRIARYCHMKKDPTAYVPLLMMKMLRIPELSINSVVEDMMTPVMGDHPILT